MSFEKPTTEGKEKDLEKIIDDAAKKDPQLRGRFQPDATQEVQPLTPDDLVTIQEAQKEHPEMSLDDIIAQLKADGLLDSAEDGHDQAA